MLDLLIRGGLVLDGSGSVGFRAAIGVSGDTLHVIRGDLESVQAARVIDATGRVVCPGFIDCHAHSGLMILANRRHDPKVRQGVTTEVIGVDGNSYAPFRSTDDFRSFVELNAGLDGDPELPHSWETVAAYLSEFDGRVAVNIAYLVGNSALRIAAVGWEGRPAAAREIADMASLLRESLEEGAYGLSTGLDYPPGQYADTAELVALSGEVSRYGGVYHTHVRNTLGDRFLDPIREAIEIGERALVPVHVTHLYKRAWAAGGADALLRVIEDARDRGLDVTFDTYPYTYASTRLPALLPAWAHEGGPQRLRQVLGSTDSRQRLRDEVRPRAGSWQEIWLTNFRNAEHFEYDGRSIAEIAAMRGVNEVDAICDLLLEEGLHISYVSQGDTGISRSKFVAHPLGMVGSDAVLIGDHPSPRTYGTFPAILGEFVREEGYLTLPEAIRKMTSYAAQRFGIKHRGLLRDGMRADVVIFDPVKVASPATRSHPKQFPIGIEYVLVNGAVVVDDGSHTGILPGRALRRGRD